MGLSREDKARNRHPRGRRACQSLAPRSSQPGAKSLLWGPGGDGGTLSLGQGACPTQPGFLVGGGEMRGSFHPSPWPTLPALLCCD